MVRRYAHLAAEHLAVYAGNTESYGTNTAQPPDFHGTAKVKNCSKLESYLVAREEIEPRDADFQAFVGSSRGL
jgi:hypothetical protein